MHTPQLMYKIAELAEKWDKYGITEEKILQMAAVGTAALSIWFDGKITINKNGTTSEYRYKDLATLPLEESKKFLFDQGIHPEKLLDKSGNLLTVTQVNKHEGIFWRDDLCMLTEEVERLDNEFVRLETEQLQKENTDSRITNTQLDMILDKNHPWHSESLAICVLAWLELYSKRQGDKKKNIHRPNGGNSKFIHNWFDKNINPLIGPTTRQHYQVVINPSKQGGPKKIE